MKFLKKTALVLLAVLFFAFAVAASPVANDDEGQKKDYIKWVDFNAPYPLLKKLCDLEVKYHGSDVAFNFCEVLSYLSVKNGNSFNSKTDQKNLNTLLSRLKKGEKTADIISGKYYDYFLECYRSIFKEFFNEYTVDGQEGVKYGLTAYYPFANGYWCNHYDDFGNSRSFGYKRRHLGHDMFGAVGTPIASVEGGTVKELGWNRYGGWRVGVLSSDGKRYYYYAHLRKDHPYAAGLKQGDTVSAGQIIGYLGKTGYSNKENVNLKTGKPHLHFGMQLIFDESQIKGSKEIWIDVYGIVNLLSHNKARVTRDGETKEFISKSLRTRVMPPPPVMPDKSPDNLPMFPDFSI